ncbi:MAG: hypothetical protein ABIO55_11960 [Ginsengibacter sp.]
MSKFLKNIGWFIFFVIISYPLLVIFWGDVMPHVLKKNLNFRVASGSHLVTKINEISNYKNSDILILGSSHAYREIDTRILKQYGYKAFNLGSSAQTPVQSLIFLQDYVNVINPKFLFYEVFPQTFEIDGVESSLDLLAYYKINKKVLNMAFTINNIRTYNTLIFGYCKQLFGKNKNLQEDTTDQEDNYISGGFVEKKKITFNQEKAPDVINKIKWTPRSYQLSAFEKMVSLAKNKNIKLILIQTPVTSFRYAKYSDNENIDKYFSGKAQYYNFNKLMSLSDSVHFYDDHHLNQIGVRLFDDALMKYIFGK